MTGDVHKHFGRFHKARPKVKCDAPSCMKMGPSEMKPKIRKIGRNADRGALKETHQMYMLHKINIK